MILKMEKTKRKYFIDCKRSRKLLRYLTVKLSPVLLGVKPSVMLRITNCKRAELEDRYNVFCVCQEEILKALSVEAFVINRNQNGILVLFYDKNSLLKTLDREYNSKFLNRFGYVASERLELKLERLKTAYDSGRFPHEVGIFLGYPLKDVKGFLENRNRSNGPSLKCGWRVYGNPRESLKLKKAYSLAEKLSIMMLKEYRNIHFCINRILSRKGTITIN
jgi:hypothetical protein